MSRDLQTEVWLTHITDLVARLRPLHREVQHRQELAAADGYPARSAVGGGRPGGWSDPVANLAIALAEDPKPEPAAAAYRRLADLVVRAGRLLEQAESAGKQALPPGPRPDDNDACASCRRAGIWSPIFRSGRCRWCGDWARAHAGENPPVVILRARHEGRRITTRLVAQATGADGRRTTAS